MINRRLLDYLESTAFSTHSSLDFERNSQQLIIYYVSRPKFAMPSHIEVFLQYFDMKKLHDTIWRFEIHRDLSGLGI